MALRKRVLTFRVRKTVLAPSAVIAQVKMVAINAWITGERFMNVFIANIMPYDQESYKRN
jgi:hypothetical protein